jgi:tetratricopeptide (TPR) repeat protein
MSAEDLDQLLRERYANYQNNDSFEEWLARISSGNALFVTQFLHTLEEDGYIDRAGGYIKDHYESITPPATLQAVIRERIRRLNADARDVLRYASVEGDHFTLAVLSVVTEIPKLKLLQQLRHIEDDHHLIHFLGKQTVYGDATSVYEFSHALLHRMMYESLGEEERELLHEAVFALIENAWATAQKQGLDIRTIAPRFAVHADVLGQHQRAAEVLLQGVRANWQVYAGDEALRLLDGVFEQLSMPTATGDETAGSRTTTTANAHSLRGQIYFHRGHLAMARQEFQTALELLEQTNDTVGVIDNLTKTAIIDTYDGEYERAATLAQSALEHARQIDHVRGVFTAMNTLANIKRWTAPSSEVLDWRMQVLDAAQRCGEGSFEEGVAFSNLGIARQAIDDIDGALECYNHALEIYSEHNDTGKMADALNNIGTVHLAAGRLADAREVLERCCDLCKAIGDEWMEAYAVNNIADVEFKEEEYQAALEKYHHTAAVADRVGDRELGAGAYFRIGAILRSNGDLLQAVEQYQQSLERYHQHNAHDQAATVCIEIADIFLQLGDSIQARNWSEHACERASLGVNPAVIACATGELGLVEAAEAQQYVGVLSHQKLVSAINRIEQCISALQAVNDSDLEKWKTRLTELRGREG